jgi:hypothetical protein
VTRPRRSGPPGASDRRRHGHPGVVAVRPALIVGMLWLAAGAGAESFGGITPGETTRVEVEKLFGRPSRERTLVEEGRTVSEWTFAAERAPRGVERMVVSFGLMVGGRFVPDVVRAVTLYPNPHVFSLLAITNGWGMPDAIGTEEATGRPSFHYRTLGLLIILDKTGAWAELLLFGPRQSGGGT